MISKEFFAFCFDFGEGIREEVNPIRVSGFRNSHTHYTHRAALVSRVKWTIHQDLTNFVVINA